MQPGACVSCCAHQQAVRAELEQRWLLFAAQQRGRQRSRAAALNGSPKPCTKGLRGGIHHLETLAL